MSSIEKYGRFLDSECCFELVNDPPHKWVNLHYNKIGEHEYYAECSNIGDGVSWVRDNDGVTCNLVSYDSKYLYIRDDETNKVFSPWGCPAPTDVEDRSCKFWAAGTVISGTCDGLQASQRFFVPRDYTMEVWTVNVKNLSDRPRKISIFAYALFQLTGCDKEGGYLGKVNFGEVLPEIGGAFITNRNLDLTTDRFHGFLVALNDFRAANAYRDHFLRSDFSVSAPKILWGWNCDNRPGFGPDCAGTVQVTLDVAPGATARADFLLGQATCPDDVKKIRDELTPEKLDAMCEEQIRIEKERAATFQVRTGNANYDSLMNHFVKKQMYSYLINKSGFRDNLQMDNALCLADYPAAEQNLLRALSSQYADGSVPHGFRPLNRLQYSDKPAWIFLAVPNLIKESGDLSLLEREIPYFESNDKGTVWDHMLRAMRFMSADLGKNGLCDQHHADWNDGLEATREAGDRESVMVTQQLCYGLREMKELARMTNKDDVVKEAGALYDTFAKRLNEVAWDGEWYVRTICGDGYRFGSKDAKEAKIFVNTQSWAVMSGIAPEDRARLCMESVEKHLKTELGYRVLSPSFSEYDARAGRISLGIPGHVENGGVYCHASGFKGMADCILGKAEEAWNTFVVVAPDNPKNLVSVSGMEPFSFTNSFSQCEYVYGQGGYPWRTGTAGWFVVLLVEWILGARRSYDGLLIDPCLSVTVPEAFIKRTFRGAIYNIAMDNTAGRCKGAQQIEVDGQPIDGNVLPVFKDGTHEVKVVI